MIALLEDSVIIAKIWSRKLEMAILKQAVRDVASKDSKVSSKALLYFFSKDFENFCDEHELDGMLVRRSIKKMYRYPKISRQKVANDITKLIDNLE